MGRILKTATGTSLTDLLTDLLVIFRTGRDHSCGNLTQKRGFRFTMLRKILSSRAKMKMKMMLNFHGKSSGIGLSGIGIRTGLGTRITCGRRTRTAKVGSRIGGCNGNIGGGGPRCEDHVLVPRRPAGLAENGWVLGAPCFG